MKEHARNTLVGFFSVSALSAAALLMVWFGETPSWLQRSEWTLQVIGVSDIRGVGEGSPVRMGGVEIGRVAGLTFENEQRPGRGVIVNLRIKNRFSVPQGSIAKIYGSTLGIGTGQISILVPTDVEAMLHKDGSAIIRGEMASVFGDVLPEDFASSFQKAIEQIGELAEAGKPAAKNLAQIIEARSVADVDRPGAAEMGITPNLSTAVERFDTLVANANDVLGDAEVQDDIRAFVHDMKAASDDLRCLLALWEEQSKRTSNNLNDGIDRTERGIDEALARITNVAERLDSAADNLAMTTAVIARGDGTLGKLTHDPRLYEAAVLSAERLSELLATLNRITGKIEEDGYISLGRVTPVGTITKKFPVGQEKQSAAN